MEAPAHLVLKNAVSDDCSYQRPMPAAFADVPHNPNDSGYESTTGTESRSPVEPAPCQPNLRDAKEAKPFGRRTHKWDLQGSLRRMDQELKGILPAPLQKKATQ